MMAVKEVREAIVPRIRKGSAKSKGQNQILMEIVTPYQSVNLLQILIKKVEKIQMTNQN